MGRFLLTTRHSSDFFFIVLYLWWSITLAPFARSADLPAEHESFDLLCETCERRKPIPNGGYSSPWGPIVHPSCFQYASEKTRYRGRKKAERAIDLWFEQTFLTVTQSCASRYENLKDPYLKQWVTQFKRTVLTCSAKLDLKRKTEIAVAANISRKSDLPKVLLPREMEGIDLGKEDLEALPSAFKTTIVFPKSLFSEVLTVFASNNPAYETQQHLASDTLIHEVLHSTQANNRRDHNQIRPNSNKLRLDRILVITRMCTRMSQDSADHALIEPLLFPGSLAKSPLQLAQNLKNCHNLFTSRTGFSLESKYLPSKGLSAIQAASLCQAIASTARCWRKLRTEGARFTKNSPLLMKFTDAFRKRFTELALPDTNEISPTIVSWSPRLQNLLSRPISSSCLQDAFQITEGKAVRIATPYTIGFSFEANPGEHILTKVQSAIDQLQSLSLCDDNERRDFLEAFQELHSNLAEVFRSAIYQDFVLKRLNHQAEASYRPPGRLSNLTSPDRNSLFRELIGEGLYDSYLYTLEQVHHLSPKYECVIE
ncbi:MAG: hypothetical protein AB1540_10130 [Bdellovibrionota bacterium]